MYTLTGHTVLADSTPTEMHRTGRAAARSSDPNQEGRSRSDSVTAFCFSLLLPLGCAAGKPAVAAACARTLLWCRWIECKTMPHIANATPSTKTTAGSGCNRRATETEGK